MVWVGETAGRLMTRSRGNRNGNGAETQRKEDTDEEDDGMEVGWKQGDGKAGKKTKKKRKKTNELGSESSLIDSEEDRDTMEMVKEEVRIILKFKGEKGILGTNPMILTQELRKKVGEIPVLIV